MRGCRWEDGRTEECGYWMVDKERRVGKLRLWTEQSRNVRRYIYMLWGAIRLHILTKPRSNHTHHTNQYTANLLLPSTLKPKRFSLESIPISPSPYPCPSSSSFSHPRGLPFSPPRLVHTSRNTTPGPLKLPRQGQYSDRGTKQSNMFRCRRLS